jgi:hypothetical protein
MCGGTCDLLESTRAAGMNAAVHRDDRTSLTNFTVAAFEER